MSTKKSRSGETKRDVEKRAQADRYPRKWEDLDRARFKQLLSLDPRLCSSRDKWDTRAIASYLNRHGHPDLHNYILHNALVLSGFRLSNATNDWRMAPPNPIPPSPRAFEYRLKLLQLPEPIDPALLVPTQKRLELIQGLAATNHWMPRSELVARVAPGMHKNSANTLLSALLTAEYIEERPDTVKRTRYFRRMVRLLPHGRRTVELMRPFAEQLTRSGIPTADEFTVLQLLREFPNGLYSYQIYRAAGRPRSEEITYELLCRLVRNGLAEIRRLQDSVDGPLWNHDRRFYRITSLGERWLDALEALAESRFPELKARNAHRHPLRILDDGDIPVAEPFTEDLTVEELAEAEAITRQRRAVRTVRLRPVKVAPSKFEDRGDGCLTYRGPPLPVEAALAMGFGLAVQRLRVRAGMTQENFANRLRLPLEYVLLLEAGQRTPPPARWKRISAILGTTRVELVQQAGRIIREELLQEPNQDPASTHPFVGPRPTPHWRPTSLE